MGMIESNRYEYVIKQKLMKTDVNAALYIMYYTYFVYKIVIIKKIKKIYHLYYVYKYFFNRQF